MKPDEALTRTLLLMRDEVREDTTDETLVKGLTGTRVALVANERNMATHAAQTAFVTAATLMIRSGHQVHLLAPENPLIGPQPPLAPGGMIEQLVKFGNDLLPGTFFDVTPPIGPVELAVGFGDTPINIQAARRIWVNADSWVGSIECEEDHQPWRSDSWPLGAMAAAALAAGEAFKAAMHRLRPYSRNVSRLDSVFRYTDRLSFALAPPETPFCNDLGNFDCVSGGAIINGVLYALSRIPNVVGHGRVIEPDKAAMSNLNRYMLLRRSALGQAKATDLAEIFAGSLYIEGMPEFFESTLLKTIIPLAPSVLVGVDDIPSRWTVQEAAPKWLAIGATTHWSAMASYHAEGLACARCLHNADDPSDAPIPTVAFVSFWAGLLVATYFLRHLAESEALPTQQQIYLTPLRAENPWRLPVPFRPDCPTCLSLNENSVAA